MNTGQRRKTVAPPSKKKPLDPKVLKAMFGLSLLGAVAAGAWILWDRIGRAAYPIQYVRIEGMLVSLDEGELREAIAPLVGTGFFDVDLSAIEAAARSFAWVEGIQVLRQWPDTVTIQVREHRPLARWNEVNLLSDRGVRFSPPELRQVADLPRLYGVDGQEALVLDVWRRLNGLLARYDWRVVVLELNPRQSWSARLSDGKELIIGRQDPLLSVGRFLKLVPQLAGSQVASIKKADLRYRNGFAVVWRVEPEGEATPAEKSRREPLATSL